jgi:hypothetical protein
VAEPVVHVGVTYFPDCDTITVMVKVERAVVWVTSAAGEAR